MNKRIAGIGLGVLVVNSGYLVAFAKPSIFYMGNVLLHLGLGLALMVFALLWARRYPWECGAFLLAGLPALYLAVRGNTMRSEEHTSELQSLRHLVCRLL